MPYAPTPEQSTVIEAISRNQPSSVEAVAGSGKTSTIIAGANNAPASRRLLCLAFNKSIATTLSSRLTNPSHVAMTLNGLGHRAWGRHLKKKLNLLEYKVSDIIAGLIPNDRALWPDVRALVEAAKNNALLPRKFPGRSLLPDTDDSWQLLCDNLDLPPEAIPIARAALSGSVASALSGDIDFSDQLYMSWCFNARFNPPFEPFEQVLVDEAQDLNLLQHAILSTFRTPLIAVGDPFQAIYYFRGATADSMSKLSQQFSLSLLPMTVCFRCPTSVISYAQQWVPHIQPAEGAAEGSVTDLPSITIDHLRQQPPNTAILCRYNAPLLKLAFRLIRERISCRMEGRDIGRQLTNLIKKVAASDHLTIQNFLARLEQWRANELARISEFDERKRERLMDRYESILSCIDAQQTVAELITSVEQLFARTSAQLTLSSIHKAKGLEWPNVIWLRHNPREWSDEEVNIHYVACTRAQSTLTNVWELP